MNRILKGILKYRKTYRNEMVAEFERVRDHPEPKAVFFTCMDSRMLPTRFTQTHVGDMFIIRNAGNLVPDSKLYGLDSATTEPAALELGCVINDVKHVVVCGHSDCKAMNLLYRFKKGVETNEKTLERSPLKAWLHRHGSTSLKKFEQLEKCGFKEPLTFPMEGPFKQFVAYIDPDNRFNLTDKLSQLNTLQQLQHVASYSFIHNAISSGRVHIHALWFDIYTGDIYYFSRSQKRFVEISESTAEYLLSEIQEYFS